MSTSFESPLVLKRTHRFSMCLIHTIDAGLLLVDLGKPTTLDRGTAITVNLNALTVRQSDSNCNVVAFVGHDGANTTRGPHVAFTSEYRVEEFTGARDVNQRHLCTL